MKKTNRQTGKLNILVVDDDENVANLLAKTLKYLGCSVKSYYRAEPALLFIKKHKPQLAFIDIELPGMNGYELAQKIKESKSDSSEKMKLVALTGRGQEKDKQLSKSSGFDAHLVKPVDIKTLKKTIYNLVGRLQRIT